MCQNDTLQRENRAPSGAGSPGRLALHAFHLLSQSVETTLRRRGQRLQRTNYSTTILRPSVSLHHPPGHPPSHLPLPAYRSLILPLPYLEPYNLQPTPLREQPIQRLTFSHRPLGPSSSPPFLSSHLSPSDSTASFLPVLLSATGPRMRPSLSFRTSLSLLFLLPLSLFFSLSLSLHRAFSRRPSTLSPTVHPGIALSLSLTLTPLARHRRLTRALILPYPPPRPAPR